VMVGIEQEDVTEINSGLKEGQRVISTGAAALRPGDRIIQPGQRAGGSGNRAGGAARGGRQGGGTPGVNANQGQTAAPAGR